MLPAISRGLQSDSGELWKMSATDQAKIILRLAQAKWFARELDYHPITSHAAAQKLKLNRTGLAQHYGIARRPSISRTGATSDAFFATCRETERGWEPVESGIGINYRVELKTLDNPFGKYEPLGPQLLPRPSEQCAWVAVLPLIDYFVNWPNVMIMQFNHNKRIGEHFLQKFDGGKELFPPDPLADVAAEIRTCREVPNIFLEEEIEWASQEQHGIRSDDIPKIREELSKLITIIDYRRLLTERQVSSLMADFEWRKKMLSPVKANLRPIRYG